MKKPILGSIFIVVSILITSCTSMKTLKQDVSLESSNESIFIIGVSPENHRISVFPGEMRKGLFHQNPYRSPAVYTAADEHGFVAGKANAGEYLAIMYIRVVGDKSDLMGTDFIPCEGGKTMVFEVPAGKVIYLGDVQYQFLKSGGLGITYDEDFAAAQRYVKTKFPKLNRAVEKWSYKILATTESCTRTIYVPTPRY